MAEGEGLEPTRPKPPVFKTGALPIMLTLRNGYPPLAVLYCNVVVISNCIQVVLAPRPPHYEGILWRIFF